ncbi:Vps53-like protein [Oesophagostomum dentatum]|uniref:Vps53-like protein n=1 Tax=Oesophagostomum dentatum TaxID=61180 RepID=A0A0B1TNS0_OESDE|nr:Vps53-like protein [Oesophagostomum dentatum]
MTRDIKQLDIAKRNLTSSITTLHHLHILLTGVDSSALWVEQQDYASITRQLPAILKELQLFDDFQEVEQMARITNRLNRLKQSLTVQLAGDMKAVFQAGQLSERVTDMCRVAAALEGSVKENFCKWFIVQQLAEYTVLYVENEKGAWLDRIEERDVLYRMMTRRRPNLDFRLLGHAIQHTRMFEALLNKRFPPKAKS